MAYLACAANSSIPTQNSTNSIAAFMPLIIMISIIYFLVNRRKKHTHFNNNHLLTKDKTIHTT